MRGFIQFRDMENIAQKLEHCSARIEYRNSHVNFYYYAILIKTIKKRVEQEIGHHKNEIWISLLIKHSNFSKKALNQKFWIFTIYASWRFVDWEAGLLPEWQRKPNKTKNNALVKNASLFLSRNCNWARFGNLTWLYLA